MAPVDPELQAEIARAFELPEQAAAILARRAPSVEAAGAFLTPRLRDQLPDPNHLLDMDRATDRIAGALERRETIAILADYDVDGATSGALLRRILRGLGAEPIVYVPDREREGYGPNPGAMRALKDGGAAVVVTVDCGATAFEAIEAANAIGLDVVVLDHHVGADATPPAHAVVNPNRADETSAHGHMAAVGVVFLFAAALRRRLGATWPTSLDLMSFLDLVALGTVADVAALTGVNRALVAQGLKVMAVRPNPGIEALLRAAGVSGPPKASHLGFAVGPRINAGGRIGASDLGLELLSDEDPDRIAIRATELDRLNQERQEIERGVLDAATPVASEQADAGAPIVAVAGDGWRQGVVGIVAGRLAERFGRPALVAAVADGVAVGSGRSISGVALGPAIIALREEGLLDAGGGHDMAAGFRLPAERFEAFAASLTAKLETQIASARRSQTYHLDGAIGPAGAHAVAVAIERLAPFGVGNPEPRFALPAMRLKHVDVVKEAHLRLRLESADGASISAMAFRTVGRPLGDFLLARSAGVVHIAGRLERDTWRGRDEARLIVEDAAEPAS